MKGVARRYWLTPLVILTILFASGCYEQSVRGDQSVYGFAWWVGVGVIVGSLIAVPLGWVIRRWSGRWSFVLIVMGPLLLVFVAPAMFLDKVVVDREHFEARYGFWFSPTRHNLRFDDMRELRYVETRDRKNRVKYELHCVMKAGDTRVVHVGDLVQFAVPEILERAKAKQVPVTKVET
jgi:hypothetical protein